MWSPLTRYCENADHVNCLALWGTEKVKAVITILNHYNHHLLAIISVKSGVLSDSAC